MPTKTKKFYPFEHPLDLLSFYDDTILDGRIKLYEWQKKISLEIAKIPPTGQVNEIDLVSNNNSGKSKMVVSPAIIWIPCSFDNAEVVLTSASGSQVDNQTGRYVKDLCGKINSHHKKDLWTIQYRKLHFGPTNSYVDIFATDEGTKAEGWHQFGFDTAFAKFVDEAKAVGDNIFEALDRCLDAQWYIRVSSPRIGTTGYFYKKVISGLTKLFKVTAYECPHISAQQIAAIIAQYGLHSPITRSIIFAEFTSVDESTVIKYDKLLELLKISPLKCTKDQPKYVGCDLAAGGDENVITYFEGNVQKDMRSFREKDTVATKDLLTQIMGSWGIPKDSEWMFFDDGHVGHSIIDMLWRDGWNVKRTVNQSAPVSLPQMYANQGAEMWFNFANFVNNYEVILLNDPTLISQLGNRYYTQTGIGSKIKLESKIEARAKGHPSPDRADATVLALSRIRSPHFIHSEKSDAILQVKGAVTQKELIEFMDNLRYSNMFKKLQEGRSMGNITNNLSAIIGKEVNSDEADKHDEWREMLNRRN